MDSLKVSDYMTLQAVTFSPDMSLSAALEKSGAFRQHGRPCD